MNTHLYCLKEISNIKSGKRLPSGHVFAEEKTCHAYVRARDIKNGVISSENLAYISDVTYQKIKRYIIQKGDIAITIVANIGDVGYCEEDCHCANLTENAVRLTNLNKDIVDAKFLALLLGQSYMKQYMESLAAGAAQAKLGIYKIKNIKVSLPEIKYQHIVVSFLSSFDSQIKNNTKRIKLLEESARELYKEWFVRMRFPGYEKTMFVKGIPEGWTYKKVTDLLEIKYGKDHKVLGEGDYPCYGSGGIIRYVDKYLFEGESVLIPRKGSLNNIMIANGSFWTIDTMFYTIPKMKNVAKYAYYMLSSIDMESLNAGAALPSMTTNILSNMDILLPSQDILKQLESYLSPLFNDIEILIKENQELAATRDRLLPRLLSGELKVTV